jgi:hypothetical protein
MIQLTDDDVLLRLGDTEDSFVERKTQNDLKDCLKTTVAFANSTPIGYPAIMFVGVKNSGEVEGLSNPDNIQKSVSEKISPAYPPIYTAMRVLTKDGKLFLAVIIPGSENRPHFAGQAYIRDGSQSVPASEEQFRTLIAQRNDKARVILEWKGKNVTAEFRWRNPFSQLNLPGLKGKETTVSFVTAIVLDCTQFYVTLRSADNMPTAHSSAVAEAVSYPLGPVELSFDHRNGRLMLMGLRSPG